MSSLPVYGTTVEQDAAELQEIIRQRDDLRKQLAELEYIVSERQRSLAHRELEGAYTLCD